MSQFRTHTGELVEGERLEAALRLVAGDCRVDAHDIRREDAYASHVAEEVKERELREALRRADAIEAGNIDSFTIWQRVNTALTGECVPLFRGDRP